MTEHAQPAQDQTLNNKELNFRQQEKALQDKYERMLAQERAERERERQERERYARELDEIRRSKEVQNDEDDDDAEPYVDKKKLVKTLQKHSQKQQQQTMADIQKAIEIAKQEAKKEAYLENNPDFYDVLTKYADKLAEKSPTLANSILAMPDTFERQKLVVQTIKELGLNKSEEKQSPIQEKINKNQSGQYYQPSNIGNAPYQGYVSDFSAGGQKAAYEKMKSLINNVRL